MAVGPTFGFLGSVSGLGWILHAFAAFMHGLIVHAASTLDRAQGPLHGKVQATPPGSPGMTPPAAPRPATLLVARRLWVGRTLGPRRTEILYPFPKSRIFRVFQPRDCKARDPPCSSSQFPGLGSMAAAGKGRPQPLPQPSPAVFRVGGPPGSGRPVRGGASESLPDPSVSSASWASSCRGPGRV